jgi:hypothetical protein
MEYLGAWGTLIHEKNLKSKTSCQTPFKEVVSKPLLCRGGGGRQGINKQMEATGGKREA